MIYNRQYKMQGKKLILVRLQKQERSLENEPIPNILVRRKGTLDFHFCIYGLQAPYKGGFYHGVLELSQDYPFSPPKLKFFTPSGRFEVDKPICTTFTDFHKQSWSSAWNVRTMLLGTLSFMTGSEGGYGSQNSSPAQKQLYAQQSLQKNFANPTFNDLFQEQIMQKGLHKSVKQSQPQQPPKQANNQASSNTLYMILIVVVLGWIWVKSGYGPGSGQS